ncbi:S1C family serine protease [Williamsia sp. CHRR-6]|uniref:S1C family serine protease n=1 Tax=Williamsia sp. CHRR-6 TaxID=2835871 RepID=UPI001BDB02B6|nr:trypsin-like peptidase domain-containing protein [Williamsia sp. CHRR-6]MBT0566593.1 trypsin-like peptidase domain-containing protein [Williamsia sp. CHRR-6]
MTDTPNGSDSPNDPADSRPEGSGAQGSWSRPSDDAPSDLGQGTYGQGGYSQGGYGQTSSYPTPQYSQGYTGTFPAYTAPERPARSSNSKGLIALGAVTLTLLAGGVGGVIGASLDDNSGNRSASSVGTPIGGDQQNTQPVAAPPGSVQDVAARVLPSVVSIDVKVGDREGEGSGVVLTSDGVILTNNHVVTAETSSGTPTLVVSYSDGSTSGARVVGADPISDIAVIKADKTGLKPIAVGTSKNLAVGQDVIAIGSPLGLAGTVTTGIISSLNRPVSTRGEDPNSTASVIDAIQTDAAINPGNSGGALVNANGALIGVNSAIASLSSSSEQQGGSIGLGFAIPIDHAMRIAKELQSTGKATQAGLGVSVRSATADAGNPGAQISEVTPNGAASKAGIPAGAVVTKVNDRVIGSGDALVAAIRSFAPGDTVKITYSSNGTSRTVQVTLDTLNTGGR